MHNHKGQVVISKSFTMATSIDYKYQILIVHLILHSTSRITLPLGNNTLGSNTLLLLLSNPSLKPLSTLCSTSRQTPTLLLALQPSLINALRKLAVLSYLWALPVEDINWDRDAEGEASEDRAGVFEWSSGDIFVHRSTVHYSYTG